MTDVTIIIYVVMNDVGPRPSFSTLFRNFEECIVRSSYDATLHTHTKKKGSGRDMYDAGRKNNRDCLYVCMYVGTESSSIEYRGRGTFVYQPRVPRIAL